MKLRLCINIILMLSVSFLFAASVFADKKSDQQKWQMIFQLDNDLFSGSDRDYTNGIRLGFVQEINDNSELTGFLKGQLPKLIGDKQPPFVKLRLPDTQDLRLAWGIGITQLMFTPDDPNALFAPKGQRPYAGWLGLEYSLHAKNKNKVNSLTLSIGTTGRNSFAEESQEWVHTNISNSPIYQGWGSQVPGELTVNLHIGFKRKISKLNNFKVGFLEMDGYYQSGVELGNFRTSANMGMLVRLGKNLPASFSAPRVHLGSYGHELFRKKNREDRKFSALVFAGTQISLVAHDITLDGPVFRNFDTGVNSKWFVGEFIFGVGARYKDIELSFSQSLRSDEFASQNENQIFGSFIVRLYSTFN